MNKSYYHEVHDNPMFWFGSAKSQQYVMAELVAALRDGRGRNVRILPPPEVAFKTPIRARRPTG